VVHSGLASLKVKAFARQLAGERAMRAYRLFYNLVALVTVLPVLALPALLPDRALYQVGLPWSLPLLVLMGAASLALLLGLLQTGPLWFLGLRQLEPGAREEGELVTGGLYRYVRHPLYSAGLVFIWASPRMTVNTLALSVGLTVYLIIGARYEERKLLRLYGDAYAAYRRKTPMFIPRFW
jgi:protein-S-isoprenylcysteine O-methyltransferase Ste14